MHHLRTATVLFSCWMLLAARVQDEQRWFIVVHINEVQIKKYVIKYINYDVMGTLKDGSIDWRGSEGFSPVIKGVDYNFK